jgi:hypothetical protein
MIYAVYVYKCGGVHAYYFLYDIIEGDDAADRAAIRARGWQESNNGAERLPEGVYGYSMVLPIKNGHPIPVKVFPEDYT